MCGFAGIYTKSRIEGLPAVLESMTSKLSSRGPDASGYYIHGRIALGHRRLSILDLTETGNQPMSLRQSGITISYNGEIYNFQQIKAALIKLGHEFSGTSDTEVILHAYEAWGLEGLKRLEGVFGFALWDERKNRLVLMRDRLGVKPVFYGESDYGFTFGSEIKAVIAAWGVDKHINEQSLREYLWFGNTYNDRTFYRGVKSLEPGHWIIIENEKKTTEAWWRPEDWLSDGPYTEDFNSATLELRDRLDFAVARQLCSDVPVGLFLSGGIDSSTIAAAAKRASNSPLTCYTASFDFLNGVNEVTQAKSLCQHLGLDHKEIRVVGSCMTDVIEKLVAFHDEPFADAANIPLYLMSKEICGTTKVVLQGDGGDELFGGYRRYSLLRNTWAWNIIPNVIDGLLLRGGLLSQRVARLSRALKEANSAKRMALLLTTETECNPPEYLFNTDYVSDVVRSTDPFLAYRLADQRFSKFDPVERMMLTDLTLQLPSQFLTKVDRATMAAGVEARVPLLDESIVKHAISMPTKWKLSAGKNKHILRMSQANLLPSSTFSAPKTGFGVPYQHWLRTSLFDYSKERILDGKFIEFFSLSRSKLERAISENKNRYRDHSYIIWKLLNLQIWHSKQEFSR
jgi:asparagine synthase (glutamine-hydrolysing)